MKKIELSSLVPGTICEADLVTENGELLVSKGMTLSEKHIDIMRRRNIYDVFMKLGDEAEELHQILSRDFKELEALQFDDPSHSVLISPKKFAQPKALQLPQLRDIKAGQEGFKQLCASEKAKELDEAIKDGFFPDRPVGPALKMRATQIMVEQRSEEYKAEMKSSYSEALKSVKYVLTSLADNKLMDGTIIRTMVERFVKTWLTDRNLLLNITHTKQTDEDYLYHHSLNVCLLSINIAAAAGYSEKQILDIGVGATLHDVGMLLIPREIFLKKGRLTKDEWYEVQKHSVLGLHLLERIDKLPESAPYIAYQTHERENGQGYPKQRNSRFIHNYSKIVQIADVFESLSAPREYRTAYMPYRAMEILIKMSRKNLLANEYVKAFITYMSLFPVGSLIELSDHTIGKVVHANELHFTKPIVSIIADAKGNLLPKENIYQVDLCKNQAIQIIRAVESNHLPGLDIMHGF
jgi:HD-GYP domain-containing protein (c-di-GMP phosphodiesterase class II)